MPFRPMFSMVVHAPALARVEMSFSDGIITRATVVVDQDDRGAMLISARVTGPMVSSPRLTTKQR